MKLFSPILILPAALLHFNWMFEKISSEHFFLCTPDERNEANVENWVFYFFEHAYERPMKESEELKIVLSAAVVAARRSHWAAFAALRFHHCQDEIKATTSKSDGEEKSMLLWKRSIKKFLSKHYELFRCGTLIKIFICLFFTRRLIICPTPLALLHL